MRIRVRSIVLVLNQGLASAGGIILGVAMARLVTQEMLGTFRQVLLAQSVIAGLLAFEIHASLFYFLPKFGIDQRRQVMTQSFMGSLVIAIVIGLALYFGADPIAATFNNPHLAPLLRIMSLYPLSEQVLLIVSSFMIALDRTVRGSLYSIAAMGGRVVVVLAVLLAGGGLTSVIVGCVVVANLLAVIAIVDIVRSCPLGRWGIDWPLVREQWSYVLPLWLTGVMVIVNIYSGRVLISTFLDPVAFAVFSCGAMEVPMIAVLAGSIALAMLPNLVELVSRGDLPQALGLWHLAARKCSFVVFPCFVFLLVTGQDVMVLLYGQDYSLAAWPFRVYLMVMPLRIAVYSVMLRALGRTRSIAMASVPAMLINVIVGGGLMWLGRGTLLAFVGPAIGAVAGTFALNLHMLRSVVKLMNVPWSKAMPWRELGLIMLVCAAAGLVILLVPLRPLAPATRLVTQAGIFFFAFLSLLMFSRLLDHEERVMLQQAVQFVRRLAGRKAN